MSLLSYTIYINTRTGSQENIFLQKKNSTLIFVAHHREERQEQKRRNNYQQQERKIYLCRKEGIK